MACPCQLPSAEQLSSGEEDEEEEEEVRVEPPQKKHKQQQQQQPQQSQQQRKAAPQHPAQTPQPVKHESAVQQRKAPATAPAKSSGVSASSTAQDREYLQALKAALLKAGPSKLAKVRCRAGGAAAAWRR